MHSCGAQDPSPKRIVTAYNLKGRGAELSELQAFNGKVTSKQTPKQPVFQAVVHACVRACVRVRVCVCVCVCLSVFLSVCLFVCQCLPLLCAGQADLTPCAPLPTATCATASAFAVHLVVSCTAAAFSSTRLTTARALCMRCTGCSSSRGSFSLTVAATGRRWAQL